jgi:TonB-dependent starch-binding outer membrane protein SusC
MRERIILLLVSSLFLTGPAAGQKDEKRSDKPVTISGKVIGPGNQPVSGAVFYIDNARTSYISNENGSYKIKVSPSAQKLKVSSSRFGVCDTLINGRTKINFIFKPKPEDQTAGVNNQPEVTGSNEAKKSKPKKMNTYNNIYQMIQNEVPGVLVNGKSFVIQQQNSFFGSSDPLLVVDGVIVNDIDYINPIEVKSISVLTGSAASLYGVNGANGVISITLIKGSDK